MTTKIMTPWGTAIRSVMTPEAGGLRAVNPTPDQLNQES